MVLTRNTRMMTRMMRLTGLGLSTQADRHAAATSSARNPQPAAPTHAVGDQ
ncbi:hypothetical protein [Pseudonocardia sp. GCM10023141]|uniref:hypothetical protein n=1 Tax=Pseudonocardia sp. GCM10023141 TaxID=3252653 RepID=UPI0036137871